GSVLGRGGMKMTTPHNSQKRVEALRSDNSDLAPCDDAGAPTVAPEVVLARNLASEIAEVVGNEDPEPETIIDPGPPSPEYVERVLRSQNSGKPRRLVKNPNGWLTGRALEREAREQDEAARAARRARGIARLEELNRNLPDDAVTAVGRPI